MSWLAKLASPGGGARKASSSKTRSKTDAREDPFPAFVKTWESLQATFSSTEAKLPLAQSPIPQYLSRLLSFLATESTTSATSSSSTSNAPEPLGPCLEYLLKNAVLTTLVKLVLTDEPPGVRCELIKWFGRAVVELDESFLVHSAVNRPLVKLLRSCVDEEGGLMRSEEEAVVEVMEVVCERIKTYPELLAIFLREKSKTSSRRDVSSGLASAIATGVPVPLTSISVYDDETGLARPGSPTPSNASTLESSVAPSSSARFKREHDFLLFAYLLRFVHREGRVGDRARSGLLSLIEIAMSSPSSLSPSDAPSQGMRRSNTTSTITPSSFAMTPAREAALAFSEYLLDSDFADVLGAGLGALYGLLPTKLVVRAAGASTSKSGDTSWDEPTMSGAGSGMVLGGMGALGEEEDAEEIERQKEEEEMRLRAMGVGISDSADFREGLDGFLKLVEFTQEVLRRSPTAEEGSTFDDDLDDDTRQHRLITTALTSSILSSLRTLFLQSVLYPSILECSEGDGSAVAVMSYLEAILEVVQEGTNLEAALLGFLMAEEDASRDATPRKSAPNSLLSSPSAPDNFLSPTTRRVKRRKSSALLIIENATSQSSVQPSSYYTAIGRFSLRDLFVSNVHSTSQPTATAALKLLQTTLVHHDRWSMGLLDVTLDVTATSFPVALRADAPQDDPEAEESFTYKPAEDHDDSDSDSDVFVYPSDSPITSRSRMLSASTVTATPANTPARPPALLLGNPLPSTPTVKAHLDSLETLLDLIASIDPTYRNARAMGGGSEIMSTGFANYLRDAEVAMSSDLGFQRGLNNPGTPTETFEVPEPARRRSTLFGAPTKLSARDFATAKTMFRHKIDPQSKVVSLVLDSLAHFFSHSPDLNLALTAVVASLALCPYRSLEGWMLPVVRGDTMPTLDDLVKGDKEYQNPASDDGDDRSVDHDVDELARHDALFTPSRSLDVRPSPTRAALAADSDSLLSILAALAASVASYRASIPSFDKYLGERRQGLFFVENLADALDLNDDGNAFGAAVKGLTPSPAPQPVIASKPPPKSTGFGAFLSPRTATRVASSAFSTPPRKPSQLSRSASVDSFEGSATNDEPSSAGVASPFAAHYRQTGSISVKPVIVSTPRVNATTDEDDEERTGPPDSPTRRLSPAATNTAASTAPSEGSEFGGDSAKKREVAPVTLSVILDNVIVLEEFLKEISGIVFVRRSLGIDTVKFV